MNTKLRFNGHSATAASRPQISRRTGQLTFAPVFDPPANVSWRHNFIPPSETARRPVDNQTRLAENVRALLEAVQTNRHLWPSPTTWHEGVGPNCEFESLVTFLNSLRGEVKLRFANQEDEIGAVLDYCLELMASELVAPEINFSFFRDLWFLLWPVLSDFNLLPVEAQNFRGMIQRLITSSF